MPAKTVATAALMALIGLMFCASANACLIAVDFSFWYHNSDNTDQLAIGRFAFDDIYPQGGPYQIGGEPWTLNLWMAGHEFTEKEAWLTFTNNDTGGLWTWLLGAGPDPYYTGPGIIIEGMSTTGWVGGLYVYYRVAPDQPYTWPVIGSWSAERVPEPSVPWLLSVALVPLGRSKRLVAGQPS